MSDKAVLWVRWAPDASLPGVWVHDTDGRNTHVLVKQETWERMVDTDKINQHRVADAFWRVWNEVGETHKHGFYESTWMAIRTALAEIGEVGDE